MSAKPSCPHNLTECATVKRMSAAEAAAALQALAAKIQRPVGIGIWEGVIEGTVSGNRHVGEHVAIFNDDTLVAPFGPRGDEESEACAALFALALSHADILAAALAPIPS